MDNHYLECLRRTYKAGDRLRCICMEDLHGVPYGIEGTVQFVDDAGQALACLVYVVDYTFSDAGRRVFFDESQYSDAAVQVLLSCNACHL